MTDRTRWEYTRVSTIDTDKATIYAVNGRQVSVSSFTDLLNRTGADGWEMIAATVVEAGGAITSEYVFKRAV